MQDSAPPPRTVRFGTFEVDLRTAELRKHGLKTRLQEKPFQLLAILLERPGEVVTREELRQKLWPADVFVDFDSSLNTAINKLREALGDSADNPRFIETLPRRGYRFIGHLEDLGPVSPRKEKRPEAPVQVPAAPPAPAETVAPAETPARDAEVVPTPPVPPRRPWLVALVLAAAVAVSAVFVGPKISGWWNRTRRSASSGSIGSLAVLPLENLSRDPEQEYFADGMTDALITELANIAALRVISRTSVMRYKNVQKSAPEIARELKVDGLVEGSVARSGQHVQIRVQLLHGATDRHLWAKSYAGGLSDILTLQTEVARAIAQEIRVQLTPQEQARLTSPRPVNFEVHEAYMRGRFFWNKRTFEGIKKGIEYFSQAIALDPACAPAHAGLADSYNVLGYYYLPPKEAYPRAKAAAIKALEIDDTLAEAHASLADVKLFYDWDWSGAGREYKRAIELNPNYATVHQWYATYLAISGRQEEALVEIKRAQALDPFSIIINADAGLHFYYARQYDRAIEQYQKTLEMDPNSSLAHTWLALAYAQKSLFEKAITELQSATALSRGDPGPIAVLGYTHAVSGRRKEALKILRQLEKLSKERYVSAAYIALIYVGLGEKDAAFEWTQKAYEERSTWLARLKLLPLLDTIRSDSRFQDLVQRVGLPP